MNRKTKLDYRNIIGKKQTFFNWFKEKTLIEEHKAGIEAEVGFDLFGFIKSKLKTDVTMREEIAVIA